MNINLTLIGQTITFAVFVWFCMKFIWPPVVNALSERKTRIADGLAAAERGRHEKELAEQRAAEVLREAREQAKELIAQAQRRRDEIVDEAKDAARAEGERIIVAARADIGQEVNQAREKLREEVVKIALAGTEQLLGREIDPAAHHDILNRLAEQL